MVIQQPTEIEVWFGTDKEIDQLLLSTFLWLWEAMEDM